MSVKEKLAAFIAGIVAALSLLAVAAWRLLRRGDSDSGSVGARPSVPVATPDEHAARADAIEQAAADAAAAARERRDAMSDEETIAWFNERFPGKR